MRYLFASVLISVKFSSHAKNGDNEKPAANIVRKPNCASGGQKMYESETTKSKRSTHTNTYLNR